MISLRGLHPYHTCLKFCCGAAQNFTDTGLQLSTINNAFQIDIHLDLKSCILGILDDVIQVVSAREAAARALFQAHRLILVHWISQIIPML